MADLIAHLKGEILKLTNAQALKVALVDGSGNQVTSFGGSGGTSSDFGAAFPASGSAVGAKDSAGTNMAPLNLDASGNLKVAGTLTTTPPAAATATLANVVENLASVTLIASNASRLAFMIENDSDGVLNVKFGAAASATSLVRRVLPRDNLSTADIGVNYTGTISGIWETTPGTVGHDSARVVELTA